MPSPLDGFTTAAGGGGADVLPAATCRPAGGRATATTPGPGGSVGVAATTATDATAMRGKAGVRAGSRGAWPLTAHANTTGMIAAILHARWRVRPTTRSGSVAPPRRRNPPPANAVTDLHTTAGSFV